MKQKSDNLLPNKENNKVLSYKEARFLAGELLEKYEKEMIISSQDEKSNPNMYEENSSIEYFLKKISEEISSKYFGHGIVRNGKIDKLTSLLLICSTGEIKGWEGPLVLDVKKHQNMDLKENEMRKFYQQSAFTKGAVTLVISKKDSSLFVGGNIDSGKSNIGAIVLNSSYYPIYSELKKRFPGLNIINYKGRKY